MPILKQHEAGVSVAELFRERNVSTALIYQWRSNFGGMDVSMMKRLKELEAENAHFEKMYAEADQNRAAPGSPGGKVVRPS